MTSYKMKHGSGWRGATVLAALWIAAAAVAAQSGCPGEELRQDAALAGRVDSIVDQALTDGFAGGVAIMRGGELVYDRVVGFSDARGQVPVTEATLFHVASISKYLTAALTLAAAEQDLLALAAPVSAFAAGTQVAARQTTFLDLLTHRSGLGSSYAAESKSVAAKALTAIDGVPFDEATVGRFRYSNDGYDLLAIFLERILGESFEEAARKHVLAPACLDTPRFWGELDLTDPRLVGQPLRKVSAGLRKRNYGMLGSAGLLIRAVDLVRLQHALWSGQVLSRDSLDQLVADRGEVSIGAAAMGAFLIDHPTLGKVLSARGYEDWGDNAILNHYLERDLVLAIVTSKGPGEDSGLAPFRTSLSAAIEETLDGS